MWTIGQNSKKASESYRILWSGKSFPYMTLSIATKYKIIKISSTTSFHSQKTSAYRRTCMKTSLMCGQCERRKLSASTSLISHSNSYDVKTGLALFWRWCVCIHTTHIAKYKHFIERFCQESIRSVVKESIHHWFGQSMES